MILVDEQSCRTRRAGNAIVLRNELAADVGVALRPREVLSFGRVAQESKSSSCFLRTEGV